MTKNVSSTIGEFVVANAKGIVMCVTFSVGLYIQHEANIMRINKLEDDVNQMNLRLDQQYNKLDNMKLDKAVFEATIKQFSEMSTDIRSIRDRLENMMDKPQK